LIILALWEKHPTMTAHRPPSFSVRLPLVAMATSAIAILVGWRTLGAEPSASSNGLQRILNQAVESTLAKFGTHLRSNQLAVTLVDLRETNQPSRASYRGDVQIYPASVIKLFYLAAAHRWMEDGKLEDTPELRRAMKDMIVESYNEATHYIVDLLTGTTSGPELPDAELDAWFEKRNAVNRYFASLGYAHVVANKKPWCEGPYGRESQSIKRQKPNRNMLSTDDTARLLVEIVTGRCVSAKRSAEMMDLMKRDPYKPLEEGGEPDQGNAFTGLALRERPGARLWSKAGWTSQARHDAACIELPNGARFVLVTFTEGHSNERGIIEAIGRVIAQEFSAAP
jgi:beta-lactamase class A